MVRRARLRRQNAALNTLQLSGRRIAAAATVFLIASLTVLADPTTFRNEGLKIETVVRLNVEGKKVSGTYESSEYDEEPRVSYRFSGRIIPAPKEKGGVYMHIKFDGSPVPYPAPPGIKSLLWHLKIVDHRVHLFIPMQERSYDGKTPKWVVSEVEFTPAD